MTWRALVVGLGQIGMGYDLNHDPDRFILTHARSFQIHPDFELVGGVDPDSERTTLFEVQYSRPGYLNLEAALIDLHPDVVAISTPTSLHAQTVRSVLNVAHPKAILCEKPLAYNLDEAQEIVANCTNKDVKLYVNYMRRSDRGVNEIKTRIGDRSIAQPVKGISWYSKGLLNNGSHFLNLLQYWLGQPTGFQIVDCGRLWDNIDPEPDVRVDFELGTVVFLASKEENYSHYTIELVASNGRLRYEQGGSKIFWQGTIADSTHEGYKILDPVAETIVSSLDKIQWSVVDRLSADLKGQKTQICSGQEALETQEIISKIVQSL
ncbi:Gfo/Idh/MocA family protein [Limnospira fusiformis]|uniref:Gfo/Idh/MocA family protein n=1 Tax=Limnospira fusiformis TaxID=54297 RepID=UPI0034E0E070